MADKKITQLTNITGADLASADEFVVVDITADETKAITFDELKTAFDTGTGFVRVTGDTMTGDLSFGDNDKAIFGAGSDLQIYHTGSTSYISDVGDGDLLIQGSNAVRLTNTSGSNYFQGTDGAQVQLYYGGATKLTTTSTGIDVTGTVTADGLTVSDGTETTSIPATADRVAFTGASLNYIQSAGSLFIQPTDDLVLNGSGSEIMRLKSGNVGIGNSSPDSPVEITTATSSSSDTTYLKLSNAGENVGHIDFENGNGDLARITGTKEGSGASANDGILAFSTAFNSSIAERMRIDSSGRVGIGTSSPSAQLELSSAVDYSGFKVSGTNHKAVMIETSTSNRQVLTSYKSGSHEYSLGLGTADEFSLYDNTNSTERMRIDSSGNLLVGTTDPFPGGGDTNTGVSLSSTGAVTASRDGDFAARFNRKTSDGEIIGLNKDGASVGSIGVVASDRMYISTSDGLGLQFDKDNNRIVPVGADGSAYNNNVSLGSSGLEFKDLYLSGGVYLGGTGSANLLDSYEEGTWTPDISWAGVNAETYSRQIGSYVKIGQFVYCSIAIIFDKNTSTGSFGLGGFPFTNNATSSNDRGIGKFGYFAGLTSGSTSPLFLMENNGTFGYFRLSGGSVSNNGTAYMDNSNIGSTVNFHMDVTYRTTQ